MKEFLVCVMGTSYITVEADTPEDAKQSARDIFDANRVDEFYAEIVEPDEVSE